MDLKITPKKLQRLINLAEAADTPQFIRMEKRNLAEFGEPGRRINSQSLTAERPTVSYDSVSSSGILDLDACHGIGESQTAENMSRLNINEDSSINKNSDEIIKLDDDVEELKKKLDAQSSDIASIVRQSIACDEDFIQGNMTAHEAYDRRSDISVSTNYSRKNATYNSERRRDTHTISDTESEISVGAYFKMKSTQVFSDMPPESLLSGQPSMAETDSRNYGQQPNFMSLDDSDSSSAALDAIPVKEDWEPLIQLDIPVIDLTSDPSTANSSPRFEVGARCNNAKPPTALNAHCKQRLGLPLTSYNNESSVGDASLSMSVVAKALKDMDSESSPSSLFGLIKRNPPSKPVRNSKINSNKENITTNHSEIVSCKNLEEKYLVNNFEKNAHDAKRSEKVSQYFQQESKCVERLSGFNCDKYGTSSNVVLLSQVGKTDTASSSATINTILRSPETILRVPAVHKTAHSDDENENVIQDSKVDEQEGSFTPHANSTVSDAERNIASDTKCSTIHGLSVQMCETVTPKMLSPDYQPLDTSINWEEIIPDRNISKKDDWLKVEVEPAKVYVGVTTVINIKLRSLYDSVLTCNISTQKNAHNYALEFPKIPKLLRARSIGNLSLGITTDKKFHDKIPLKVVMQDLATYEERRLDFSIDLKSCDPHVEIVTDDVISGDITFPNAQRGREVVKVLALKSDSNVDLLLEMEVTERFSIHSAKNIPYEAVTSSVNTALRVTAGGSPRAIPGKIRMRARGALLKGSALAVTIVCHTPCSEEISSFEGAFRITLMNTNRALRTVPLHVRVGTVKLHISQDDANKLCNMESGKTYNLGITNAGTTESAWRSNVLEDLLGPTSKAFNVTPAKVSLKPNEVLTLQIVYKGPPDSVNKGILILKNIYDSKDSYLEITGGKEATFKTFPIRATHRELSWTKANVNKELRLKNTSDMTIRVKCQVRGEAFKMAVSGLGEIEEHSFHLSGQQCVNVSLVYRPLNSDPAWGRLQFSLYDDPNNAKSVRLHASADKVSLVWFGVTLAPDGLALVTLPVGVSGHGATLTLAAKGDSPAFISASFDYNWQYRTPEDSLRVTPVRAIVRPGSKITLKIDVKNRLKIEEMEGKSVVHLATLEVLTGPLVLKKRLERILESEAQNEELKRQLERLRGHFEGEEQYNRAMSLEGFQESSRTVAALMSELTLLKAGVTLRPDTADTTQAFEDNSIAFNYLTLCDSSCFPENR